MSPPREIIASKFVDFSSHVFQITELNVNANIFSVLIPSKKPVSSILCGRLGKPDQAESKKSEEKRAGSKGLSLYRTRGVRNEGKLPERPFNIEIPRHLIGRQAAMDIGWVAGDAVHAFITSMYLGVHVNKQVGAPTVPSAFIANSGE
jgi:hypothetical protein